MSPAVIREPAGNVVKAVMLALPRMPEASTVANTALPPVTVTGAVFVLVTFRVDKAAPVAPTLRADVMSELNVKLLMVTVQLPI